VAELAINEVITVAFHIFWMSDLDVSLQRVSLRTFATFVAVHVVTATAVVVRTLSLPTDTLPGGLFAFAGTWAGLCLVWTCPATPLVLADSFCLFCYIQPAVCYLFIPTWTFPTYRLLLCWYCGTIVYVRFTITGRYSPQHRRYRVTVVQFHSFPFIRWFLLTVTCCAISLHAGRWSSPVAPFLIPTGHHDTFPVTTLIAMLVVQVTPDPTMFVPFMTSPTWYARRLPCISFRTPSFVPPVPTFGVPFTTRTHFYAVVTYLYRLPARTADYRSSWPLPFDQGITIAGRLLTFTEPAEGRRPRAFEELHG